jgi:enediyne biosynthesis protein E4
VTPFQLTSPGIGSPGRLFLNDGRGAFTMTASFGQASKYTTGVAVGDYDNNGFPDIVVVATTVPGQPGRPLLLRNAGNDNNWVTVRLVGTASNRLGIGARLAVRAQNKTMVREIRGGDNFLSTDSPWPTFGLGRAKRAHIQVTWPSGRTEHFQSVAANQIVTLVEGQGNPHHDHDDDNDDER